MSLYNNLNAKFSNSQLSKLLKNQSSKIVQLGGFGPFSLLSSLYNPARTADNIGRKVNKKLLEVKPLLVPAIKTALSIKKHFKNYFSN